MRPVTFIVPQFKTARVVENMSQRSLMQDSTKSRDAVQFPHVLLQVSEGKVSANTGSYIEVSRYIYKFCSVEYMCDYSH